MHLFQLCGQCSSKCEVILDRVYRLLSLAKNHGSLIPDYNKSPFDLYLDVLQDVLTLAACEPDLIDPTAEGWFSLAHILQRRLNPYKRAYLSRICSMPDPSRDLSDFDICRKGRREVHALTVILDGGSTNESMRRRQKLEKFLRARVSNLAIAHWDEPLLEVFLVNDQNYCAKRPSLGYSRDLTAFYYHHYFGPKSNTSALWCDTTYPGDRRLLPPEH